MLIAVQQSAIAQMSDALKARLAALPAFVGLGQGVLILDPSGHAWSAFDDNRIGGDDIARGAVVCANLASLPAEGDLAAWADSLGWSLPTGDDVDILALNGAPTWLVVSCGIPDGWSDAVSQ